MCVCGLEFTSSYDLYKVLVDNSTVISAWVLFSCSGRCCVC